MARRYHVEGTKTYLIWAVVLAALSLWHIIDGWVPQTRWRGAEAEATFMLMGQPAVVRSVEPSADLNGQVLTFTIASPESLPAPVTVASEDRRHHVRIAQGVATLGDLIDAIEQIEAWEVLMEGDLAGDQLIRSDGDVPGRIELIGGRTSSYPNFPEKWYDLGLHEFYAYNRWTGILMGIASLVCFYIHRVVR